MNKLLIVAKREFIKVIKTKTFWLSTLFFPIFIVVVSLISSLSAVESERLIERLRSDETKILIQDDSGIVNQQLFEAMYSFTDQKEEAIEKVKNAEFDAYIYIPQDPLTSKSEVYIQDKGLLANGRFNSEASELLKQSVLSHLDSSLIALVKTPNESTVTVFKDGEVVDSSFSRFVVPIVSVAIYFILTTLATNYLLMSVSEEKENRVIEVVLSTVTPRQLIWGKILGQVLVIITQLIVLLLLCILAIAGLSTFSTIPIDLSNINISIPQILVSVVIVILSFLFIAATMVGVGASTPTYKEAQNFSAIFIIISIFPVYFFTIILAEPAGQLAQILSYVPFTSGFILVFRNALDAISPIELILGILALALYAYLAFVLAYKLFEKGSMEYGKRLGLKDLRSK